MQMSIRSINPYNQSVLNEFEEYSNSKLEYAMDLAQNTFDHWKSTSFTERSRLMHICADLLEERIESLGLNPDRADVITQASKIFLTIMETGAIKKIYVPQIGLADGIIKTVYMDWMEKNEKNNRKYLLNK